MQIVNVDAPGGAEQFAQLKAGDRPIHRIGSGLGNQLFAVSEVAGHGAFTAILDVREAQHTQHVSPQDWLPRIAALGNCVVVAGSTGLQWCAPEAWEDLAHSNAPGRFRTGWRPSADQVAKAGLFVRGVNPFAEPDAGNATDARTLGVHVRRAAELRYRFATIGELEVHVYRQMLDLVPSAAIDSVRLAAATSVPHRLRATLQRYGAVTSLPADPLLTLSALSRCEYLVMANSTFSWWAGWFSNGVVIMPRPWYITDQGFDAALCAPGWQSVQRTELALLERSVRYQVHRVRWGAKRRLAHSNLD